jgi:hypothetical protein
MFFSNPGNAATIRWFSDAGNAASRCNCLLRHALIVAAAVHASFAENVGQADLLGNHEDSKFC